MAPSKKQDGRSKRNSKTASENNVSSNTRRSSSRSSSRKNSSDSGKNVPASNKSIKNKSSDHLIGDLEPECESLQENSSQNISDIDIYGDLAEELGFDGETEPNVNYKAISFEPDLQTEIYHKEDKSKTPIKDTIDVASKQLEDDINTKQKDPQLNSEKSQDTASERKSNENKGVNQANLDLFDDLIISRKNQVSSKDVLELKQELERVNTELQKSREHCAKLEEDNEQLLKNTSALWKTALAQIRGKIAEISALKREKEQIIFRRAMRQVARDDLDRAVSRIAAYNKEEFAEFMESLKKEPSCNCGGAGVQVNNPGQKYNTLNKSIQEKVLGNRVGVNDDRDTLMLQKHLGKAGERITLHPDLQQKQKNVPTNRQHINKRETGLNKKKMSKKNMDENEKEPEDITKERAKNRLTSSYERCDRYVEEVGDKRLGHENRTHWRDHGDEGRRNTRGESRKNEFQYENSEERYDSRRTRSSHCKEGSGTNESDGDLLTDQRRVRRESRLNNERNASDDEVYSSRRRTRSRDKKDLGNRIDRSGKMELTDDSKRGRNKRKRSESPDKDIRIKRESRRNKSKEAQQKESNTRMSVFERLGKNKGEKFKADDIILENHSHDQRKEDADKYLDNGLADTTNIIKRIDSDGTHEIENQNEDYPLKAWDHMTKNGNAIEINVDIANSEYDQIAENIQYNNDIDYEKIRSQSLGLENNGDNVKSTKISDKKQKLGSLNDENGMPNTLFAQRMKDRLAGKCGKTASPKSQVSSDITKKSNVQSIDDTKESNDSTLPDILQNLMPSINSCELKSIEGNSSVNSKYEQPKIEKDKTHPISKEVKDDMHHNNSASKETNSIMNADSKLNTSIVGQDPKTLESSRKVNKGKEILRGCLKDLLMGFKKSKETVSNESKDNLDCKEKCTFNDKNAEKKQTDSAPKTDHVLNKGDDDNERIESKEKSSSDEECGLKIDETVNLDHASSNGNETILLAEDKDKLADIAKTESKEKVVCDKVNTLDAEETISLQLNDNPINLDDTNFLVSNAPVESKIANINRVGETNENNKASDKDSNLKREQTNSLHVNDSSVNPDNDFDSLEDILSDMGLKVSPKHDSTPLPFDPQENDKDIKLNLPVEDKANGILMPPCEDTASKSLSSSNEKRGSSDLVASFEDIGNKEISDSCTAKSLNKVSEQETNIKPTFVVEEKGCNKQVPDNADMIPKDDIKIPKRSFRIPKLKKTPSKTDGTDKASKSFYSPIENRSSVLTASVDEIGKNETVHSHIVKSVDKDLDLKTNIEPNSAGEEIDCNIKVPDNKDIKTKDIDKIPKRSFRIPKLMNNSLTGGIDKASKSFSSPLEDRKCHALTSVDKIDNDEMSDSHTIKTLDKGLELNTNIKLKTSVEKDNNKQMPNDKENLTKEIDELSKKSFTIPKHNKTPTKIEFDIEHTTTNALGQHRRSKRKSTEKVKNDSEFIDKSGSTVRKNDGIKTESTVKKTDSFTSPEALKNKESQNSTEKKSLATSTSTEVQKQKETKIVPRNKSKSLPDQVETKSIQSPIRTKLSKSRIESDSFSDKQESNSSSEEHIGRSKVRKTKTQRSRTRRLRIESDSSTDEDIKNDTVKSPIMPSQIKEQSSENLSLTETSPNKSQADSKCSDESPKCDRNEEDMTTNTSYPQHFKKRVTKKHNSVVLTAVSSTVVNCSPSKDCSKNIFVTNSKEISETHAVKSLEKLLEQKSNIETRFIVEEKDALKQSQDKKNIVQNVDKMLVSKNTIDIDKNKYKIPKIKNTNIAMKEDNGTRTNESNSKRGSAELKDTMSMLRNIVARNVPKQTSENVETKDRPEKCKEVMKEIIVSDIKSKMDVRPKCNTLDSDANSKSDYHTKKENKGSKDINEDRKISDDIEFNDDLPKSDMLQTDISVQSEKHAKKDKRSIRNNSKADRKSKRISLLFDENSQECEKLPLKEECKKSNGINSDKEKKIVKSSKRLKEKVAKKISSLFDEDIPTALSDNETNKAILNDCSVDGNQDEDSNYSYDSSICNSKDLNESFSDIEENKDKNFAEKEKSQREGDPKSSSLMVTESHQSASPKMGDLADEQVSVSKENDSHIMMVTKDLNMSDTDSSMNILIEDKYKDFNEIPKIVNKAVIDTFNEVLPRTPNYSDTKENNVGKNTFTKVSESLENIDAPAHNDDFLELFATDSLAGDTDIDISPTKKQSKKSKEVKNAKTNIDKWKQSFSGKSELEPKKSKDKNLPFIKVDCKSAFGIEERKIKEPEVETRMSRKLSKEKDSKSEWFEATKKQNAESVKSESSKDNAMDKRATKSLKVFEKSVEKLKPVYRRSPRKHQNTLKKDDGESWLPVEEELLFDESDSSVEGKRMATDVSRNLFEAKPLNSKYVSENHSNEMDKYTTKEKSSTFTSVNDKENNKERNHKSSTKSDSERNDTRRTSSRHRDGSGTMQEKRSRSSPSRERRSDRKLRSPVRSPNRKLRSPVRSPNRKLRSPVRSPNRKLRSPVRSPNRKLRSPLRSSEKYPHQRPPISPRQRESPKGRTSPRSKLLYDESNISPKGRPSPKRKDTDYRGRERNRRDDRRPDSVPINTRERSTRSRKESTHDEKRLNIRGERKASTHDEVINDHGYNRNSDMRRSRHSSGEEKRLKGDHRRRLDYRDKQRDRDERSKEIRGRSDEKVRRERDTKQSLDVGDYKMAEKLSEKSNKQEEANLMEKEKTKEKLNQDKVTEPELILSPISKAPVNPELIKKFTESQSSDWEEGELDDEEEGEIRESENEETEEPFVDSKKDASLNKRSKRSNENDIEKGEVQCDAKIGDCKAKNKFGKTKDEDDSKNNDDLHNDQKKERFSEKRILRKEVKKQESCRSKEETSESRIRKETEELLDAVWKDEYVNKKKKCTEKDKEKDRMPSDTKYKYQKVNVEENENVFDDEKHVRHAKENKPSRRDSSQDSYKNKNLEKTREKNTRPVQHKRSPTRSERSRRRITPTRIGNAREFLSRRHLRSKSRSPRKFEYNRRKDEESHERKSRGRVITDRSRGNTPLIDHSQRPPRRIKPIALVPEPDPSTLFRVTKIAEPKESFFSKFMSSIGLENQPNLDDNLDYLGRTETVKNQLYSDTNESSINDEGKEVMPKNLCDKSEVSHLSCIAKSQQETIKSLEMEGVIEADTCQIMQEKKYAENTVTMVHTYKLEEIEKLECKDDRMKSSFDIQKMHPLDPRLKLLSKNISEEVSEEKVDSPLSPVGEKVINTPNQEEDISSSIDLHKQLELSSDVNNQDSNSNSMDVFGKISNPIKIMNTASESSKDTTELAADEKEESDSDDSSSSDCSTTEDSSSCPAAPSSSSRSSNLISSSSKSSHINSISKSPKTVDTPSLATKRLNFGDFKIPKSLNDNSILPDVEFPLKSGNEPIAIQFGDQVLTSDKDDTDIPSQEKEIENTTLDPDNKSQDLEKAATDEEITHKETISEMGFSKIYEDITEEAAHQTSSRRMETAEKDSNVEMDNDQMNTDNIQTEQEQDDTTAEDNTEIADETMVMEDLHLEDSDSDTNHSVQSNVHSSKCDNSSSSSSDSSSGTSDSDTSSDSDGEKEGATPSDPTNASQTPVRRSARNSLMKTPIKSPNKSPTKFVSQSHKLKNKSPMKSPTKSSKSPSKSPSKSYISLPPTPRTPKTSNTSKDPVISVSPSMPCVFDITPKKSPKKHNISYKKTPSPQKKDFKSKSPKKTQESSKSPKMTKNTSEEVVAKSPYKRLLTLDKSPRKSPRLSPSKCMSPEKSPSKLTSPKTPGKTPTKSLRSPSKKMIRKSPPKFNNTPIKFTSPEKSPWKTSSPRTPGKDLMAAMMSPPMAALMSPGHTISHLWKSPKKTIRKNEPLLLTDHMNYLPFQSPTGEKSLNLIDEDVYNSPVLKKDENIAVKEDELSLLLDLENLASEAERDENEKNVPNKSLNTTSGEEDSVLSALALSPEETPARPHVSRQENVTPKSVNEVSFRKENHSKVDVTPKVCNVLSTPKPNGAAEVIENFSITPKANLQLQATSTPKFLNTETPKTSRSKLLQQEIHVTPITNDLNLTPKSNSETTVHSSKTLIESLQDTPKSHKISADNSKELGLDSISLRKYEEASKINSDEKSMNNSIVGFSALHNSSEENKGNKSNNISGSSKEPSPGSPRRNRAHFTASGHLRVPRRRPNLGVSSGLPAFSCSQAIMKSISIVHSEENTIIDKTSHKKQLFTSCENGPTKRALSPSGSPVAETENMPDKKIKIMSPRSYHQNVSKRSLVAEGSTQQVTKKILNGDNSSNLSSNIMDQTPSNENTVESKTIVKPLSLIGSNQTVKVRYKKRKRDFNPTKENPT